MSRELRFFRSAQKALYTKKCLVLMEQKLQEPKNVAKRDLLGQLFGICVCEHVFASCWGPNVSTRTGMSDNI